MNKANGSLKPKLAVPGRVASSLTPEHVNRFVESVRVRERVRRIDTLRSCVEYSGVLDYLNPSDLSKNLNVSCSADLSELALGDATECEVIPEEEILLPPPGKAWARVRSNIVPPKNCKEKFFVPYLGDDDEHVKASSRLADDLMDDDSDDEKNESKKYNEAEDGRFSPEDVFNRSPFAKCIPDSLKQQGDDSDAELERCEENRFSETAVRKWDRVFKRLAVFGCINEYGAKNFKETVTLLGKALNVREDTVHRYFSNSCWRAYQWARENNQDDVNIKHRTHLINLIRNESRTPTTEILASDSVPHFFCRQCKEYDCWVHSESEGHDLTPSQIPFDGTRKDALSDIDRKKLEEKCQFRGSSKCWYSSQRSENDLPLNGSNCNGFGNDVGNTLNGSSKTELVGNPIRSDRGAREILLVFRSIFGDDFCRLAECLNQSQICKVTCTEVGVFVKSDLEPLSLRANTRPNLRTKKKTGKKMSSRSVVHKQNKCGDRAKPDYTPCLHEGPCTMANCICMQNSLHCEKYCRCSTPRVNGVRTHDAVWCVNAYRGCSCKGGCKTKQCDCFGNDRECDPDFCLCLHAVNKDGTLNTTCAKCSNAGIRSNNIVSLVCGHSSVHGWGVYARHPIAKGTLIGQYTGEFLVKEEGERRGRVCDEKNSSYLFLTTDTLNVDSSHVGNKLRFINHSTHANCIPRLRRVDGTVLVGMYALRDIQAFEELLFNYNYDAETGPEFARQFKLASNQKRRKTDQNSHAVPQESDASETS